MKKNILAICSLMFVLFFNSYVSAMEMPKINFISTTQVNISGTVESDFFGKNVSLVVLYPNEPEYTLDDLGTLNELKDNKSEIIKKIFAIKQTQISETTDGKGRYAFDIKLDENSPSGKYILKLAVLGTMLGEDETTYSFKYFSKGYKEELTACINNAAEITDEIVLQIADVLNINPDDISDKAGKIKKMLISERGNGYADFENVTKAWRIGVFLNDVEKGTVEKTDFFNTLATFGIDTAEYETIFDDIKLKTVNCGEINSLDELEGIMRECRLFADIKAADRNTFGTVLEKYKDIIFNTNSLMNSYEKYTKLSDDNKIRVNAVMENENDTLEKLRNKFIDGMKKVSESGSGSGGKGNNSGGSSKTGGSGGKNSYSGIASQVIEKQPQEPQYPEFEDADSVPWAKDGIKIFAQLGIISGADDGKFYPENNVTRAEFIKMLVNVFGIYNANAPCYAPDAPENEWYGQYVASAQEAGVVVGDDNGNINPNEHITRQDIAVMIYRMAKKAEIEFKNGKSAFSDYEEISDYAREAVNALSAGKIIYGKEDDMFKPCENSTRAEAVTMLYRIWKLI